MNKEKVFIEGHVVGLFADTLGTKGKQIQIASGDIVDIDDNFIYKSIEPEKVKVPQCVADWISFVKTNGLKFKNTYGFYEEIAPSDDVYRVMYYIFKESIADKGIIKWVDDNIDTFARAWLDGYEVEKEKRYLVKVKSTGQCLSKYYINNEILSPRFTYTGRNADEFTRKELEEADFGWVFDCPGVEIEEVE